MKKLIRDTLCSPGGHYSIKRVGAFVAFYFAIGYEAACMLLQRSCNEYVFEGLLLFSATGIGLTVVQKFKKDTH